MIRFVRKLIPNWLVNTFFHLPKALLAVVFYRYPARNLTVIGVTGTDGKTTTSTLIFETLNKAGKKAALISSVCAKIGKKQLPTGLHVTSPDSWEIQRLLRLIVKRGFKFVVLESTSHGLVQNRLYGCNFKAAVITNVTDHEHLDYHKTYTNYLKAKAILFKNVFFSILNKEDKSYDYLKQKASGKIITYGFLNADFTPLSFHFKTKLPGDYNQLNCLAAIACCKAFQIKDQVIRQAVASFAGVKGRMEEIKNTKNFRVFIDFAHTPNGLLNALATLRSFNPKKLIAVFGCAGLRDYNKRPIMGKIACQLADKIVLTAEDPRTEDLQKIIEQIADGCKNKDWLYKIKDRQEAINFALNKLAEKGDIVGIFGKGCEQSMCFGVKEHPWSEHEAVQKALEGE